MKTYKGTITLTKNSRGVYDIDTTKGCFSGMYNNERGCYDNCYSAMFAKTYGHDFKTTVIRRFKDDKHIEKTVKQISKIDMPFVRIGNSGDPSENWDHTISVCKEISKAGKPIVIITKHWQPIPRRLFKDIEPLDLCINTSVSALDSKAQIKHRLAQYNILKRFCRSVLRIVSCRFNTDNNRGLIMDETQRRLFDNESTLDNILRLTKSNELVLNGVVSIEKTRFLTSYVYASINNKNTYFGGCTDCPEMCGINI